MKNKRILISTLALMALAATASPFYANAAVIDSVKEKFKFSGERRGNNFGKHLGFGRNMASTTSADFQEKAGERYLKMEAISKAFKDNDYAAWVVAAGSDNPLAGKVTADNFSKISEAYNLMEQAKQKMEESGLAGEDFRLLGGGFGLGSGFGSMNHLKQNKQK